MKKFLHKIGIHCYHWDGKTSLRRERNHGKFRYTDLYTVLKCCYCEKEKLKFDWTRDEQLS